MSFLLDSTIGLVIIYIGLKLCQYIVIKKGWDSLRFGEYGKKEVDLLNNSHTGNKSIGISCLTFSNLHS